MNRVSLLVFEPMLALVHLLIFREFTVATDEERCRVTELILQGAAPWLGQGGAALERWGKARGLRARPSQDQSGFIGSRKGAVTGQILIPSGRGCRASRSAMIRAVGGRFPFCRSVC